MIAVHAQTVTVTAEAVGQANLRAAPDVNADLLGQIVSGTSYPVIGRSELYPWVLLEDPTSQQPMGWVYNDLVKFQGDIASVPITNQAIGGAAILPTATLAPVSVDATILDAADTAGVSIDNACRSGTCASCRVKLVSGRVTMAVEEALTDQDRAEGYILACQAKIQGDVEVDA